MMWKTSSSYDQHTYSAPGHLIPGFGYFDDLAGGLDG